MTRSQTEYVDRVMRHPKLVLILATGTSSIVRMAHSSGTPTLTLRPSLTLACGTWAGNLSTDNISTDHLLNIHRIARLRPNARWLDSARAKSLDPSITSKEIQAIYSRNY
jgi:hypothetical protein